MLNIQLSNLSFYNVYKLTLCFLAFFFFFLKMNNYPFSYDFLITYKVHYIILGSYILLLLPIFIECYIKKEVPPSLIYQWILFYSMIAVFLLFYHGVNPDSLKEIGSRVFATLFLISAFLHFSSINNIKLIQKILFLFVLFSALSIVAHFIFPGLFYSSISSRPSGTFSNPNQAAICLVLGMILCLESLSPKWKEYFILFIGLGVFLTFSRAGLLCYLFSIIIFIYFNEIKFVNLIKFLIIPVSVVFILIIFNDYYSNYVITLNSRFFERFFTLSDRSTDSLLSRLSPISYALEDINSHFAFGKGLGSARLPPYDEIGPHNIYLKHMIEGGLLGIITFPIFLWISIKKSKLSFLIALPIVLGLWGFFSHNILDEPHIIILIALFFLLFDKTKKIQND